MEKKKIDRIIEIVRENMVVGNGGYTNSGDPKIKGGFDPVMSAPIKREKNYAKGGQGSRKKWLDYLKSYNGRRS
jgi:hypothetical protein